MTGSTPGPGRGRAREQRAVGDGLVPSRRALRARHNPDEAGSAGDHKGRPYGLSKGPGRVDLTKEFNEVRIVPCKPSAS